MEELDAVDDDGTAGGPSVVGGMGGGGGGRSPSEGRRCCVSGDNGGGGGGELSSSHTAAESIAGSGSEERGADGGACSVVDDDDGASTFSIPSIFEARFLIDIVSSLIENPPALPREMPDDAWLTLPAEESGSGEAGLSSGGGVGCDDTAESTAGPAAK